VQGSRYKLFACSGFPQNKHRRIGGGNLLDSVQHIFQRFALTDDIFKVVFQFDFFLQVSAFGFQLVFQLLDLRISGAEFDFGLLYSGDVSACPPNSQKLAIFDDATNIVENNKLLFLVEFYRDEITQIIA
jgi:hypothetical protein